MRTFGWWPAYRFVAETIGTSRKLPAHRGERDVTFQHFVPVSHIPGGVEHEPGSFFQQVVIDLIRGIGWPVIVGVDTIEIENDRYAFPGEVVMVAAVVDAFRIGGVVEFIVQLQL